MIKNLLVNILRRYYKKGSTRKIFFGPYKGLRYNITDSLENRISIFYKGWETEVIKYLQREINEKSVVYICGAHVGLHAIYASKLAVNGETFCFEPSKDNIQELQNNINLNKKLLGKIRIIGKAVGSEETQGFLRINSKSSMHKVVPESSSKTLQIKLTSLDIFSESHSSPDFILIDVENHEMEVLKGAESVLTNHKPCLIIEAHSNRLKKEVVSFLEGKGYYCKLLDMRNGHHIFASIKND